MIGCCILWGGSITSPLTGALALSCIFSCLFLSSSLFSFLLILLACMISRYRNSELFPLLNLSLLKAPLSSTSSSSSNELILLSSNELKLSPPKELMLFSATLRSCCSLSCTPLTPASASPSSPASFARPETTGSPPQKWNKTRKVD